MAVGVKTDAFAKYFFRRQAVEAEEWEAIYGEQKSVQVEFKDTAFIVLSRSLLCYR